MNHQQPRQGANSRSESVSYRVTMIPMIDMGEFRHVLSLPLPTKANTFGFRYYHPDIPMYSPIDLAVAIAEWYQYPQDTIKDLQIFFKNNPTRVSESKIKIGITKTNYSIEESEFIISSIIDLKILLKYLKAPKSLNVGYESLRKTLKRNAPLTFNNI